MDGGQRRKSHHSLWCLLQVGAQPVLPALQGGKETLHGKHHSSYGRAQNSIEVGQFFHSPMPACAGEPTEWTLGLSSQGCSLQAWLNEENSSARLSERHFLQAASSTCKAVDWLLLNARKSRMCQACAAGERGMNQPKDPYRWQQAAAGLLLPVGCHAAPHHGSKCFQCWQLEPSEGQQQQNVKNYSEASRKHLGLLWNAGVWALNTCFSQCRRGRSLGRCLPHQNPNPSPRSYRKGAKIGELPLHRFVLPVYAGMSTTICHALLE